MKTLKKYILGIGVTAFALIATVSNLPEVSAYEGNYGAMENNYENMLFQDSNGYMTDLNSMSGYMDTYRNNSQMNNRNGRNRNNRSNRGFGSMMGH